MIQVIELFIVNIFCELQLFGLSLWKKSETVSGCKCHNYTNIWKVSKYWKNHGLKKGTLICYWYNQGFRPTPAGPITSLCSSLFLFPSHIQQFTSTYKTPGGGTHIGKGYGDVPQSLPSFFRPVAAP